jgi:hypothetical protein
MIQTTEVLRRYQQTSHFYEQKARCLKIQLSVAEPKLRERIALYQYTLTQLERVRTKIQGISDVFMSQEVSIAHFDNPANYYVRAWVVGHCYFHAEKRMLRVQQEFLAIVDQLHHQLPVTSREPFYKPHRPPTELTMARILGLLETNQTLISALDRILDEGLRNPPQRTKSAPPR